MPAATDPHQSATLLRRLVKSGVLKFTDMSDAPDKFFLAHRLLATVGLGGFGVRFTVQFNLFAGSIVGLAGPDQISMLEEIQRKGQLGCFLLTEMQAGVLSGLIVETTADWCAESQEFILHTPSDKAAKNWISQVCGWQRGECTRVLTTARAASALVCTHTLLMNSRSKRAAPHTLARGHCTPTGKRANDMS